MNRAVGYRFTSKLTLEQMFQRLTALGTWRWYERDNDNWGYYISAAPPNAQVKILIDPDDGGFAINVKFASEAPTAAQEFAALHDTLIATVVPAIGGGALAETQDYE